MVTTPDQAILREQCEDSPRRLWLAERPNQVPCRKRFRTTRRSRAGAARGGGTPSSTSKAPGSSARWRTSFCATRQQARSATRHVQQRNEHRAPILNPPRWRHDQRYRCTPCAPRAPVWGQRNEIHLRSPTRPARPPARPQVAVLDTRAGAGKTARYTARCQYTRARSPLPRPPPRARTSAALSATRHATTDQELSTLSRGALFVRCFLSE